MLLGMKARVECDVQKVVDTSRTRDVILFRISVPRDFASRRPSRTSTPRAENHRNWWTEPGTNNLVTRIDVYST